MSTQSFHDQLSIDTPEHVSLRFAIAGLGSRFLALFADTVIQAVAYMAFILLLVLLSSGIKSSPGATVSSRAMAWTTAAVILLNFLLYWGYFTLFECVWHGQTPGKRIFRLRVIKDSGRQITMFESAARNLLRAVDALPGFYMVAIVSVLVTRDKKRLGDMVAGTLVVHEEEAGHAAEADSARTFTAAFFDAQFTPPAAAAPEPVFPATAIARLTADDMVLLDTFFLRIPDLDVATKERMAARLLATLCAKMQVTAPESESPRTLLESIAYQLRGQTGLQVP